MTRKEANIHLAAILTTLAEIPAGAPSGHLYAAMLTEVSLSDYQMLIGICKGGSLITEAHHVITLTDKGRALVKQIKVTIPNT